MNSSVSRYASYTVPITTSFDKECTSFDRNWSIVPFLYPARQKNRLMIESPHHFKGASYVATAAEGSNTGQLFGKVRTAPEGTPGESRVDSGSALREKRDSEADAVLLGVCYPPASHRAITTTCRRSQSKTRQAPTRQIILKCLRNCALFLLTLCAVARILFIVRFNKTSFTRVAGFLIEPHNLSGSRFFCFYPRLMSPDGRNRYKL